MSDTNIKTFEEALNEFNDAAIDFGGKPDPSGNLRWKHGKLRELVLALYCAKEDERAAQQLMTTRSHSEPLKPGENRVVRRLMQILGIAPCGDHSCVQRTTPVKGMGTNGGCRCADNVESFVYDLHKRVIKETL